MRTHLAPQATLIGDATGSDGYISSPESRTIWATLTPAQFQDIFGTPLLQTEPDGGMLYWNGGIAPPAGVAGLWFDFAPWDGPAPAVSNLAGTSAIDPQPGPFSIGNALAPGGLQPDFRESNNFSGDIADWFCNFPLAGLQVPMATVGLIEPLVGTSGTTLPFQQALDAFRSKAGIATPGSYYVVANNGQSSTGDTGERSLDVGVVSSANPGSTLGFYVGSGVHDPGNGSYANSSTFTAYQAAFWDAAHRPAVVSSSFGLVSQVAPGSPFLYAVQQLFIDAALANVTIVQANNDFGSSWGFFNGLANQTITLSSPYVLMVGGTSLTTLAAAPQDITLNDTIYAHAMAGDLATLWLLIQGGLKQLPSAVAAADSAMTALIEGVWNTHALSGNVVSPKLDGAAAGDGGVDTTQPTPWYQTAFGLAPASANPGRATGRGAPDVAANAGGNMFYKAPSETFERLSDTDGTSAAAPLWAALVAQLDTVFHDQGLPDLGFMHDLLYTAAAIAPGSFNDITFGNNITSVRHGGQLFSGTDSPLDAITLTGFGYHAGPGYDLTTGLGTPNGTLLARSLTAIGHHQMSFGSSPAMLDADGQGGWTSGADQILLFQTMSADSAAIGVTAGQQAIGFVSDPSAAFAWTNQLAQQSLQSDFDPHLVRLFDKQAHGWVAQQSLTASESLTVRIDGGTAQAVQGMLTTDFGFADFFATGGDVRVARAVAVAETASGANDQTAIVRLRQNGEDSLSISFYRVDDFSGSIGDLQPGAAGYAAAAQARAYHTETDGTAIAGPGYGNYTQTGLVNVDAGDVIAMRLTNHSSGQTYWGFAQANENINGHQIGHLWNYGLNTWGFEDLYGGGDRDYNDLVVGLDFTSASGHGWLV